VRTYRFFFVPRTEDVLVRARTREEYERAAPRLAAADATRRAWLENVDQMFGLGA
jgi:paired amphipathic helix protein Sin3a